MREHCNYNKHYRDTTRAKITASKNERRRISQNTTLIARRFLTCLLLNDLRAKENNIASSKSPMSSMHDNEWQRMILKRSLQRTNESWNRSRTAKARWNNNDELHHLRSSLDRTIKGQHYKNVFSQICETWRQRLNELKAWKHSWHNQSRKRSQTKTTMSMSFCQYCVLRAARNARWSVACPQLTSVIDWHCEKIVRQMYCCNTKMINLNDIYKICTRLFKIKIQNSTQSQLKLSCSM